MLSLCRENGMNARISSVLLPVSLREQGFGEAPLTDVWGREEEDRCSPRSARVICVNVPGHASSLYSLSHAARGQRGAACRIQASPKNPSTIQITPKTLQPKPLQHLCPADDSCKPFLSDTLRPETFYQNFYFFRVIQLCYKIHNMPVKLFRMTIRELSDPLICKHFKHTLEYCYSPNFIAKQIRFESTKACVNEAVSQCWTNWKKSMRAHNSSGRM